MAKKLLLTAALALLVAGAAHAYVTAGRAWPDGVIGYYNAAPDQAWAVRQAVDAWNSSGAHVRLVAVSETYAEVRIEHFPGVACTTNAEATIGYAPNARIWIFRRDDSSPHCNRYVAARLLAHEFGHVLGLGHELHACATMNPINTLQGAARCGKAKLWQWRCRLLNADDIAGAVALYGGAARRRSGPSVCDLYAATAAPTRLAVQATTVPGQFRISFRRPESARVPAFLTAQGSAPESYVIGSATDGCPQDAHEFGRQVWTTAPGGTEDTYLRLPPGVSCISVWAVDTWARPSTKPATLAVKIGA